MTNRASKILYCVVEHDTANIPAGHWFFHEGERAQCAQAYATNEGGWDLYIDFQIRGKPLTQEKWHFGTIEKCKAFIEDYFELPVVDIAPADFPTPDR